MSIDSERVLSSIKKIITEHSGDILPKNIIMPTIIHYTHEEPPVKVQGPFQKLRHFFWNFGTGGSALEDRR